MEAQRFIGKCLVNASKRLSAKELLLDPFLASDEVKLLSKTKLNQKPFLNEAEMEKLQLSDDPPRTDMTITGKLNPEDDTIFLKVQIADKDGMDPSYALVHYVIKTASMVILAKCPDIGEIIRCVFLQVLLGTYIFPLTF